MYVATPSSPVQECKKEKVKPDHYLIECRDSEKGQDKLVLIGQFSVSRRGVQSSRVER